jgi:hypothetical protein
VLSPCLCGEIFYHGEVKKSQRYQGPFIKGRRSGRGGTALFLIVIYNGSLLPTDRGNVMGASCLYFSVICRRASQMCAIHFPLL